MRWIKPEGQPPTHAQALATVINILGIARVISDEVIE